MKKRGFVFFIIIAVLSLLPIVLSVNAPPFRTIEYRGIAKINGSPVADGSNISIYTNNGTLKMDEVQTQFGIGFYHHLEIIWDNLNTSEDEGVYPDEVTLENITFKINGINATSPTFVTVKLSQRGDLKILDLDTNLSAEDETAPTVISLSPSNNSVDNDGTLNFQYNVTDAVSGISNCSLIINGTINSTDSSITEAATQTFAISLQNSTYSWSVNCTDDSPAKNVGSSETRIVIVNITVVAVQYNVTIILWDQIIAGKPLGVNVTVQYLSNSSGVDNATVKVIERNGFGIFAMNQFAVSNVSTEAITETTTDNNGFVQLTIAPTGGPTGAEDNVGNYSIRAEVLVNNTLINTTFLNITTRDFQQGDDSFTSATIPNFVQINAYRQEIFTLYDEIKEWFP